MRISTETLDSLFAPYFDEMEPGKVVTLVELNWYYDSRQRCGGLTKSELEYIINYQLQLGALTVLSDTEYKKAPTPMGHGSFTVEKAVTEKAQELYSKEFWEKYREINT